MATPLDTRESVTLLGREAKTVRLWASAGCLAQGSPCPWSWRRSPLPPPESYISALVPFQILYHLLARLGQVGEGKEHSHSYWFLSSGLCLPPPEPNEVPALIVSERARSLLRPVSRLGR